MSEAGGRSASGRGGDPGRLPRTVVSLIAVDVLLVVALAVVIVLILSGAIGAGGGTGGTGAVGTAGPGRPTPTAPVTAIVPSSPPTATGVADLSTFRLPSGNISCDITDEAATCVIASFAYTPPSADTCSGTVGHVLVVDANGASIPCRRGDAPAVAGRDTPVLDYGRTTSAHGFTCESSRSGVSCRHDASGHQFTVARAAYSLG